MMKRIPYFGILFLFFLLLPVHTHAFERGYERKTEEIYATVRHDLAVYSDTDGDFATYLSSYCGIKCWKESSHWYRIEYTKKNETRTGYITKDDLYADCLIYDGRDKQTVADGDYNVSYVGSYEASSDISSIIPDVSIGDSFHCTFKYIGNNLYRIINTDTEEYLQPDPMFDEESNGFWGSKETAGAFYLKRVGKYFKIKDSVTNRSLIKNESGIICYDTIGEACWKIRRYDKAITDESLRVFVQYDAEWADHYYGPGKNDDPSTNLFCTSACGIFSTVNAIYSVTGMYANPYDIADYAVEKNYRILDNGTDSGIFKAAAKKFGKKYGFSYDGSSGSIDELKERLNDGEVAITHVPGHYTCIVDYDKKKNKFLLLDPHYLPKRATFCYGDWISVEDLESGNLMAQEFFFYKGERPED